jgi:hypothetical protein
MSSLALKIQNARNLWEVDDCLVELKGLKALIRLAGKRIKELEAEEMERRAAELMPPQLRDLG